MQTRFLLVMLAGSLLHPLTARAEFALKTDDRVVFFGDTLVQSRRFTQYVEAFVRVKYPQLKTRFYNYGMRNQTAADGLRRLQEDLKPLSPTIVVVAFGLYDPPRQDFQEGQLAEFRKNYTDIIKGIESLDAKMVLVTPPRPASDRVQQESKKEYSEVLGLYAQAIREIGANRSIAVVDWFESSMRLHQIQQVEETSRRRRQRRDILPTSLAHAVVAAQLLKLWNAEPIQVNIEIDWNGDRTVVSSGQIEIHQRSEKRLSVKLTNLPLPWALPLIRPAELRESEWPGAELCLFNLSIKNIPKPGISAVWGRRKVLLDRDQLSKGMNIMSWQPIQSKNMALRSLLLYMNKKRDWRFRYWRKALPARPEEPELQEAFESYCKSLQLFEEGTARIIFRLPKTFDVVLEFEVNDQPQAPTTPTTQPAEKQPK